MHVGRVICSFDGEIFFCWLVDVNQLIRLCIGAWKPLYIMATPFDRLGLSGCSSVLLFASVYRWGLLFRVVWKLGGVVLA